MSERAARRRRVAEHFSQPYVKRIVEAWRAGVLPRSGVSEVLVAHAPDCPLVLGPGLCSCNPDVAVRYLTPPPSAGVN